MLSPSSSSLSIPNVGAAKAFKCCRVRLERHSDNGARWGESARCLDEDLSIKGMSKLNDPPIAKIGNWRVRALFKRLSS